jgi:hypothetical protein
MEKVSAEEVIVGTKVEKARKERKAASEELERKTYQILMEINTLSDNFKLDNGLMPKVLDPSIEA